MARPFWSGRFSAPYTHGGARDQRNRGGRRGRIAAYVWSSLRQSPTVPPSAVAGISPQDIQGEGPTISCLDSAGTRGTWECAILSKHSGDASSLVVPVAASLGLFNIFRQSRVLDRREWPSYFGFSAWYLLARESCKRSQVKGWPKILAPHQNSGKLMYRKRLALSKPRGSAPTLVRLPQLER